METSSTFKGTAGRRNLLAALGSFALFSVFLRKLPVKRRAAVSNEAPIDCGTDPPKTVKMLTREGVLVEVDVKMGRSVKKVTNEELRDWIKPNKPKSI